MVFDHCATVKAYLLNILNFAAYVRKQLEQMRTSCRRLRYALLQLEESRGQLLLEAVYEGYVAVEHSALVRAGARPTSAPRRQLPRIPVSRPDAAPRQRLPPIPVNQLDAAGSYQGAASNDDGRGQDSSQPSLPVICK